MVNIANKLGVEPSEVPATLLIKEGERVTQGEPLARSKGFFGLFASTLTSPIEGTLESVSSVTGQAVLRAHPRPVEVKAYVDGVVEEVTPGEGVVIRSYVSLIQGIFGIGGEASGEILVAVESPHSPLPLEVLSSRCEGKVLVGGSLVTAEFLQKAAELGVEAVVVGGIDDEELRLFLGYDIGVAVTGSEDRGVTLVITEGFGSMPMAERTFSLLRSLEGKRASVSGATQIRAGVIRPEVVVPLTDEQPVELTESGSQLSLEVGSRVRLIREPRFGALATVVDLPVQPLCIPTEAKVRVAEVELDSGKKMVLPRANLELLALS